MLIRSRLCRSPSRSCSFWRISWCRPSSSERVIELNAVTSVLTSAVPSGSSRTVRSPPATSTAPLRDPAHRPRDAACDPGAEQQHERGRDDDRADADPDRDCSRRLRACAEACWARPFSAASSASRVPLISPMRRFASLPAACPAAAARESCAIDDHVVGVVDQVPLQLVRDTLGSHARWGGSSRTSARRCATSPGTPARERIGRSRRSEDSPTARSREAPTRDRQTAS